MDFLITLWKPILVSTVVLFMLSFLVWALLPFHKKDHKRLENQAELQQAIRDLAIKPGVYFFPSPKPGEKMDKEAWMRGPSGLLTIMKPPSMAGNMLATAGVLLCVAIGAAYIGYFALGRNADFWRVFQIMTSVGIVAFCFSPLPNMIWFQSRHWAKLMVVVDGVLYGVALGFVFAWMWPRG